MNTETQNKLFLMLGIIGSFILLLGVTNVIDKKYDLIGSVFLLLTAIHFKLIYFIALELILMAGHGAMLLNIGTTLQMAIPILLCLQLLTFYFLSDQLNNIFLLIGVTGIAILSVGFSYENEWTFFIGSAFIATYSFYSAYRGKSMALLWAILNTLFALVTLLRSI